MKVAIVGAGVSGLTAIKCCLDEELEPVCFERTSALGGVWNYREELSVSEEEGQAAMMHNTLANTSKEMMAFSDFPPPSHFPTYMPHTAVVSYLRMYSDKFGLDKFIHYNRPVSEIKRAPDFDKTGKWIVKVQHPSTKQVTMEEYDAVMICTGRNAWPHRATFDGQDHFKGSIIHSQQYRRPRLYANKTVVVVGFSNSAVDTATDLTSECKQVYLSRTRNNWIASRLLARGGQPIDADFFVRWKMLIPATMLTNMYEKKLNERVDHALYQLTPPNRFIDRRTLITDDLPLKLQSGQIVLKPNIRRFIDSNSIEFDDGSVVHDVDTVVMATGYDVRFPFMEPGLISDKEGYVTDLFLFTFPPHLAHHTLAVTGCLDLNLSPWPVVELQARAATRVFKRQIQLPSADAMAAAVAGYRNFVSTAPCNSRKRTCLAANSYLVMEALSSLIGCRPSLWKTLLTDPLLWWQLLTGSLTSYQFRLRGPGRWEGARAAILDQQARMGAHLKGSNHHRLTVPPPSQQGKRLSRVLLLLAGAASAALAALYCTDNLNKLRLYR